MPTSRTAKPLRKERTGTKRLYKYIGVRKVSFYYQYPNGASETLASAPLGNRPAINEAERIAKRKAMDIQQGVILAGSVADLVDRFAKEKDETHYRDQSKDGKAVRKGTYANLIKFFGSMNPKALKMIHGYQYLEDRARAGAPAKAIKEMALFSTICHQAVKWGIIEGNPFVGMSIDRPEKNVRNVLRFQVIRFYLWSKKAENNQVKLQACAALFAYLTGFRPEEVRPFHTTGITKEGVKVLNAKRKKGEAEMTKLREWSPRLRMVIARAKQLSGKDIGYLFPNRHGQPYTKSGWGASWEDSMWTWIASFDDEAAREFKRKREWEMARKRDKKTPAFKSEFRLVKHPMYFALQNVRPTAITIKMENRSADMLDFAAHANAATTYKHYDRRKVKRASATE